MQPVNERKINKTLSALNQYNQCTIFVSMSMYSAATSLISILFIINTILSHEIFDILHFLFFFKWVQFNRTFYTLKVCTKIIDIDFLCNLAKMKFNDIQRIYKKNIEHRFFELERIFESYHINSIVYAY